MKIIIRDIELLRKFDNKDQAIIASFDEENHNIETNKKSESFIIRKYLSKQKQFMVGYTKYVADSEIVFVGSTLNHYATVE